MDGQLKMQLRLLGADNFTVWHRKVQAGLLAGSLIEHIHKDLMTFKAEVTARHIVSDSPLPAEQTRRAEALHRVEDKQNQAFSFIYNLLSESIQNRLPEDLCDFISPNPRSLYRWLRDEYSASSGARQAELRAEAWSTHIEENVDPVPAATRIRAVLTEILSNAKENRLSIADFIDRMTAYCILHALSPSFNSLAATLYPVGKESASCEAIITQLDTTYRRRTRANLEVNGQGLVHKRAEANAAGKGQEKGRTGADGKKLLGRDANAWCTRHERYGHLTEDCLMQKQEAKGRSSKTSGRPAKGKAMASSKAKDAGSDNGDFVLDAAVGNQGSLPLGRSPDVSPCALSFCTRPYIGSTLCRPVSLIAFHIGLTESDSDSLPCLVKSAGKIRRLLTVFDTTTSSPAS